MAPQSFDADRGLSKERIDRLAVVNNPQPLTRIVGEAVRVLQKSELQFKEIYVFTDLSRASWPPEDTAYLQDRLHELTGVAVYLIDVGVTEPGDFALGDLNLSHQVVAAGASVDIQTEISCLGAGGKRLVKLNMISSAGTLTTIGAKPMEMKSGESETLNFHLAALQSGTQQGLVQIMGQDPLAADDTRYFTIEVRPAWKVLLVAQPPVSQSAFYLMSALAPLEERRSGRERYKCDTIDYGELAQRRLGQIRRRLPVGSAGPRAGCLAAFDRLCRGRARRGRVPRPPRPAGGSIQLARRSAVAAGPAQGASAARRRRHLPGAAGLPEPDPPALSIQRDAFALALVPRLSLLAGRRPESRRQHHHHLQ